MKKKIWILNHYATDMFFSHGERHYYFSKYLRRAGYEPVVFGCNAMHGRAELYFDSGALWQEHVAEEIGTPFVFVRGRTYLGNGLRRVLNMADFYRNVQKAGKEYAEEHGKPDVIYASSVHPLTLAAGLRMARRFGVRCICEMRDLWPESIVALDIAPAWHPAVLALRWLEKRIYTKADALIFTMGEYYDYIEGRGWQRAVPREKTHYINNGVDLETFIENREHDRLADSDLEAPDTFKVVYTGSVRPANGLEQVIDCAEALRDRTDIRFLIYGAGETLEEYREECVKRGLENCVFKGRVERKYVPYILSKSSAALLNYAPGVSRLFRYGFSNNKFFEYLASGRPVLANCRIPNSPIEKYGCGLMENLTTGEEYAAAVDKLYRLTPPEYEAMCAGAREAAREYDYASLTKKLIDVIEGV